MGALNICCSTNAHTAIRSFSDWLRTETCQFTSNFSTWWYNKMAAVKRQEIFFESNQANPADVINQ